jgi:cellobiose-specific phosphotransferase system component IIA
MSISNKALVAFTVVAGGDRTTTIFEGSETMSSMMAEAQEKQQKEARKAIIGDLTGVVSIVQDYLDGFDQEVRAAEAAIAEARDNRAALVRASAYGNEEGNYLPMLFAVDLISLRQYADAGVTAAAWEKLLTIPEDWSPSAPAPQAD